jgi:hypothetical protein
MCCIEEAVFPRLALLLFEEETDTVEELAEKSS